MVELSTWVETLSRHPLRFKFEGLDGFHLDVVEAAKSSSPFCEKLQEKEAEFYEEGLNTMMEDGEETPEILDQYLGYLRRHTSLQNVVESDLTEEQRRSLMEELDYTTPVADLRAACSALETLVRSGACPREGFACEWAGELGEFMLEGLDSEILLDEHPPEQVLSHAYNEGVAVEDVLFVCPSCGQEPFSEQQREDAGGRFYCGLCGCEYFGNGEPGDTDLRVEANLQAFSDTLGVELYPFRDKNCE